MDITHSTILTKKKPPNYEMISTGHKSPFSDTKPEEYSILFPADRTQEAGNSRMPEPALLDTNPDPRAAENGNGKEKGKGNGAKKKPSSLYKFWKPTHGTSDRRRLSLWNRSRIRENRGRDAQGDLMGGFTAGEASFDY